MGITLKEWNNLPQEKRDKAAKLVFYNFPEEVQQDMSKEWRHNVDANHRDLLRKIGRDEDGILVVKPIIKL